MIILVETEGATNTAETANTPASFSRNGDIADTGPALATTKTAETNDHTCKLRLHKFFMTINMTYYNFPIEFLLT